MAGIIKSFLGSGASLSYERENPLYVSKSQVAGRIAASLNVITRNLAFFRVYIVEDETVRVIVFHANMEKRFKSAPTLNLSRFV